MSATATENADQIQQQKMKAFLYSMLPADYGKKKRPRVTTTHAQQLIVASREMCHGDFHPPPLENLQQSRFTSKVQQLQNYYDNSVAMALREEKKLLVEAGLIRVNEVNEEEDGEEVVYEIRKVSLAPVQMQKSTSRTQQNAKGRRKSSMASPILIKKRSKSKLKGGEGRGANVLEGMASGLLPEVANELADSNRTYSNRREDYESAVHYDRALEEEERRAAEIIGCSRPNSTDVCARIGSGKGQRKQSAKRARILSMAFSASSSLSASQPGSSPIDGDQAPSAAIMTVTRPEKTKSVLGPARQFEKANVGKQLLRERDLHQVKSGQVLLCDELRADELSKRTCTIDAHPKESLSTIVTRQLGKFSMLPRPTTLALHLPLGTKWGEEVRKAQEKDSQSTSTRATSPPKPTSPPRNPSPSRSIPPASPKSPARSPGISQEPPRTPNIAIPLKSLNLVSPSDERETAPPGSPLAQWERRLSMLSNISTPRSTRKHDSPNARRLSTCSIGSFSKAAGEGTTSFGAKPSFFDGFEAFRSNTPDGGPVATPQDAFHKMLSESGEARTEESRNLPRRRFSSMRTPNNATPLSSFYVPPQKSTKRQIGESRHTLLKRLAGFQSVAPQTRVKAGLKNIVKKVLLRERTPSPVKRRHPLPRLSLN